MEQSVSNPRNSGGKHKTKYKRNNIAPRSTLCNRFGDHCTNIAEELIFYLDAKVMKDIGKTEEK